MADILAGSTLTGLLAGSALVVLAWATLWFGMSLVTRRNDVADIAWGSGFVILCFWLVQARIPDARDALLYLMVVLWGLRLSWHIGRRSRKKDEDFRYRKWREEWGRWFVLRSYLQVFLLQGMLLWVIAAPLVVNAASEGPDLGWLAAVGFGIWCVGFFFEAVGDWQLARFKERVSDDADMDGGNPDAPDAGSGAETGIMTDGLWRYTRHPNYFGEVTLWWGVFLVALPAEHGVWALVSPVTVTVLILFVSGIPMLEEKYEGEPEWEAYKARTSAFVPLPPKKERTSGG